MTTLKTRIADGMVVAMAAYGCLGPTGCDVDVCFLDGPESCYQLGPDDRAVAFVDPQSYTRLLHWRDLGRPRFGCVVDEFTRLFENRPDCLVIVLDFEASFVTHQRLFFERGYDLCNPEGTRIVPTETLTEVLDVFFALPSAPSGAFNWSYRRFERGVGISLLDPFPRGPSTLRGYVFLPRKEDLVAGRFLHEFCHFWAAHLDGPRDLATQVNHSRSHWGYTSVGGMLGGWAPGSLVRVDEGVYQADVAPAGKAVNKRPFAPLELYLMGLIGPEEVPPIDVAVDVKRLGKTEDRQDLFSASAIKTVTIEQIVAANGPREPSVEHSRKNFKLALVILTDHPLTCEEWGFYMRAVEFMSAPEERSLNEAFPEEMYPAHNISWKISSDLCQNEMGDEQNADLPFVNFFTATGGKGTIEFVELVQRAGE